MISRIIFPKTSNHFISSIAKNINQKNRLFIQRNNQTLSKNLSFVNSSSSISSSSGYSTSTSSSSSSLLFNFGRNNSNQYSFFSTLNKEEEEGRRRTRENEKEEKNKTSMNEGEERKERKATNIFWILPLIAFLLGTWQVFRLKWKEDLIEKVTKRMQMIGENLPQSDISKINEEENEFKRYECEGKFLNQYEIILGPKTLKGHNGYWVITPFLLNDGRIVMVNRGWTPFARKESSTRSQDLLDGNVKISTILKLSKPKPQFVPGNEPSKEQWCWIDAPAMADHFTTKSGKKVLPVLLELIGQDKPVTYPTPFPAVPNLPNNHLSYVITWYGLSAALTAMTLVLTKKVPKVNKRM